MPSARRRFAPFPAHGDYAIPSQSVCYLTLKIVCSDILALGYWVVGHWVTGHSGNRLETNVSTANQPFLVNLSKLRESKAPFKPKERRRTARGPLSRRQHPSVRSPPPTHVISVVRDEAALLALPHTGLFEVSVRLSSCEGPLN